MKKVVDAVITYIRRKGKQKVDANNAAKIGTPRKDVECATKSVGRREREPN